MSQENPPFEIQLKPYTLDEQEHLVSLSPEITKDLYSSIISVILPDWPTRFQDPTFRHSLEEIIHRETPSHIFVNILWVDFPWHQHFQKLHDIWLEAFRSSNPEKHHLSALSKPLLDLILQRAYRKLSN